MQNGGLAGMDNRSEILEHGSGERLASGKWADPAYIAAKYPYESGCIWLGRNPHNHEEAIGYRTEKHVFLAAETGGGKGRAFMVNNQALWPGSLVTIGPKGDEATMTAVRRGKGNELCDGLGQKVYVLDPFGSAKVPKKYLAYYDLLSELRADDPDLIEKTELVTAAACKITDSTGDAKDWQKRGQEWITAVVQHVVTYEWIKPEARHFGTVRELVVGGNVEGSNRIYKYKLDQARAKAEANGEEFDPSKVVKPDPYDVLFSDMKKNPACDGEIALQAEALRQVRNDSSRTFIGIRTSSKDLLQWMQGKRIQKVLWKHKNGPQETFKAADLKDEKISVFICLPEKRYRAKKTWLEAMITSLIQSLTEEQGLGANGERVLFCIDEFGNLGEVPAISEALNSIRSAGVSLMIATQGLSDLQKNYPKNWERFPAAAGIEVYFQADEVALGEYLEKKLGKKEVTKYARTIGVNSSHSTAEAIAESYSHSHSLATGQSSNRTRGETVGTSETRSGGGSVSEGESSNRTLGRSRNTNQGTSSQSGYSTSEGYGPSIFHILDFTHTLQHGRNRGSGENTSSGRGTSNSTSRGMTRQRARQWSHASGQSRTQNTSTAEGQSRTETHSEQHGRTTTNTKTEQQGDSASLAESFQTIPLLSLTDARKDLISPEDQEHPAFPGMALVLLDKEPDPTFVRKANYDQDPFFVRKFLPNPSFPFVALEDMRPFGYEISPDHFIRIQVPADLAEKEFEVTLDRHAIEGEYIAKGDPILTISTQGALSVTATAPMELKLIEDEGTSIVVRANKALSREEKRNINRHFWDHWRGLKTQALEYDRSQKMLRDRREAEIQELIAPIEQKIYKKRNEKRRLEDNWKYDFWEHYGWQYAMYGFFGFAVVLGVLVQFGVISPYEIRQSLGIGKFFYTLGIIGIGAGLGTAAAAWKWSDDETERNRTGKEIREINREIDLLQYEKMDVIAISNGAGSFGALKS